MSRKVVSETKRCKRFKATKVNKMGPIGDASYLIKALRWAP